MKKRVFAIVMATVFMASFIGCQKSDEVKDGTANDNMMVDVDENDAEPEFDTLEEKLDRVSYEFETFDGAEVKVDKSNIKDVFEFNPTSDEDPLSLEDYSGYEIVAPGRDFVYASDGENYLIIDYINGIYVTSACEDANQ